MKRELKKRDLVFEAACAALIAGMGGGMVVGLIVGLLLAGPTKWALMCLGLGGYLGAFIGAVAAIFIGIHIARWHGRESVDDGARSIVIITTGIGMLFLPIWWIAIGTVPVSYLAGRGIAAFYKARARTAERRATPVEA
jgi:hypothetical protein